MDPGSMLDGDTEPAVVGLQSLPPGASARVVDLEVDGLDRERLEVMGLCAGRAVEVVKAGDPMIVRVLGTRIGLAGRLAAAVRVRRG
jgi:Fe2+ transport system protein FeoA